MGIRGHAPEVALAASGLLFAAGAAGNIASSHVGVDEARVAALSADSNHLTAELTQQYPELEALSTAGSLTVAGAEKLDAPKGWFALEDKLTATNHQLTVAEANNGALHGLGELGMGLGAVGIVGSFMVLSAVVPERKNRELNRRYALERDYSLVGMIEGLTPSEYMPDIDIKVGHLGTFTADRVADGLAYFARQVPKTKEADTLMGMVSRMERSDRFDSGVDRMLKPLFGLEFRKVRDGYDASQLGSRIELLMHQFVELYSVSMSIHHSDEEIAALDPNEDRFFVEATAHILDVILPLDQRSEHNPTCDITPDSPSYGRHWIGFIGNRTRTSLASPDQDELQGV